MMMANGRGQTDRAAGMIRCNRHHAWTVLVALSVLLAARGTWAKDAGSAKKGSKAAKPASEAAAPVLEPKAIEVLVRLL